MFNNITNAESKNDKKNKVGFVKGIARLTYEGDKPLQDSDDETDEEVQKPSIKDKLFSYISNLGSYTDFMSGFSDTFGFQEEVYEVNNKEFDKCDVNVPPNSKIVGIFDNQCVWLDDNNEIKTTDYNKDTLLDENKNTTNTNEGNAENELSDKLQTLRDDINGIELTTLANYIKEAINYISNNRRKQNKKVWESTVRTILYNTVYNIINDSYKLKKLSSFNKDNYHKYMNGIFNDNLYDKLENMKTDTEIIDAIKEYFTNDIRTIQDKVTKYINENKQN